MHRWKVEANVDEDGNPVRELWVLDRHGGPVTIRRLRDGEKPDEVALGVIWTMQRNGVLA